MLVYWFLYLLEVILTIQDLIRIIIFISFLTLGLCLTLGPILISQYKKEKRGMLDYVDNFLILFIDKNLLTNKGIEVQKYVRRAFLISTLCLIGMFSIILLFGL